MFFDLPYPLFLATLCEENLEHPEEKPAEQL